LNGPACPNDYPDRKIHSSEKAWPIRKRKPAVPLAKVLPSRPFWPRSCRPAWHWPSLQQREVMREALSDVAKRGLRGKHHFSISFLTTANGVALPSALVAQYPQEMTIILQHQFERLRVNADAFGVVLWFKSVPTRVTVPFNAVTLFVDPSVKVWIKPDPASHGQRCHNA
jgi:hypothetical protein